MSIYRRSEDTDPALIVRSRSRLYACGPTSPHAIWTRFSYPQRQRSATTDRTQAQARIVDVMRLMSHELTTPVLPAFPCPMLALCSPLWTSRVSGRRCSAFMIRKIVV